MSKNIGKKTLSNYSHETDKNEEMDGKYLNCQNSESSKEQTDGEVSVAKSMPVECEVEELSDHSENYLVDQMSIYEKRYEE